MGECLLAKERTHRQNPRGLMPAVMQRLYCTAPTWTVCRAQFSEPVQAAVLAKELQQKERRKNDRRANRHERDKNEHGGNTDM